MYATDVNLIWCKKLHTFFFFSLQKTTFTSWFRRRQLISKEGRCFIQFRCYSKYLDTCTSIQDFTTDFNIGNKIRRQCCLEGLYEGHGVQPLLEAWLPSSISFLQALFSEVLRMPKNVGKIPHQFPSHVGILISFRKTYVYLMLLVRH